MLCLKFWTEKRAHLGEDALPTLEAGDDQTWLLAVYDGLGGAGSTLYTLPHTGKQFSGAYLASRCAKSVTEVFFGLWDKEGEDSFAEGLDKALKYSLKSKLIKTLPTTLAGILIEENIHHNSATCLEVTTFWAGDSRCFFWQADGLHQISVDDLNGNPDALENLRLDATITNCAHAEGNFTIRSVEHIIDEPILFLVATDGCFGYVETPMHFEYILLETLMQSHYDMEDWSEKMKESLLTITGDDMSLALCAWGFQDLEAIKSYFYTRYETLKKEYIEVWQAGKMQDAELENRLWEQYKENYYCYIE
jgi:serine/threonine protein phosphatase PrpC